MSLMVEKDGVIKTCESEAEKADYIAVGWKSYEEKKAIVEEQVEEKPKKKFLEK